MVMKTLEFKLNLTPEQKAIRDEWLSGLRWVWNTGLDFLERFYRFHVWDQLSQTWVSCSPISWSYRKQGETWIPYCWIGKACACSIPQPYRPLPLAGRPGSNPYYWLRPYFTQKNIPTNPGSVSLFFRTKISKVKSRISASAIHADPSRLSLLSTPQSARFTSTDVLL